MFTLLSVMVADMCLLCLQSPVVAPEDKDNECPPPAYDLVQNENYIQITNPVAKELEKLKRQMGTRTKTVSNTDGSPPTECSTDATAPSSQDTVIIRVPSVIESMDEDNAGFQHSQEEQLDSDTPAMLQSETYVNEAFIPDDASSSSNINTRSDNSPPQHTSDNNRHNHTYRLQQSINNNDDTQLRRRVSNMSDTDEDTV